MTCAPKSQFALRSGSSLAWYQSSDVAARGFCNVCGSNLFWQASGEDAIYITAGSLDSPTGLVMIEHIFADDKGDYYAIDDDIPRRSQWH